MASATAPCRSAAAVCFIVFAACPACTGGYQFASKVKAMFPSANITANQTTALADMALKPTLEDLETASPANDEATTPTASPANDEAANLTAEAKPQDAAEAIMNSSSSVFGDLRSSADELKQQIDTAEHDHFKQIADHEEHLTGTLQEKRANNVKLEQMIRDARTEIVSLHKSIDELFQRAKTVKLEGKVWKDNWRELEQNLTLVMDATQERLKSQDEALSAPSVNIISELNAKTVQEQAEDYRNELMMKVVGSPLSLAMLKDPVALTAGAKTPFMIRMLTSQLSEMAAATKAELQKLDDSYKAPFQEEADRESAIRHDLAQLEERKADLTGLRDKLAAAVERFEVLKQANEKQGTLIRSFISSIAANPLPTHGSDQSWDELIEEAKAQSSRLEKRMAGLRFQAEAEAAANETAEANSTLADAEAAETPATVTADLPEEAPLEINATSQEAKANYTVDEVVAEENLTKAAMDSAAEAEDSPLEVVVTAPKAKADEVVAEENLTNAAMDSAAEAEDTPLEVVATAPKAKEENLTNAAMDSAAEAEDTPLEVVVTAPKAKANYTVDEVVAEENLTNAAMDSAAEAEDTPLEVVATAPKAKANSTVDDVVAEETLSNVTMDLAEEAKTAAQKAKARRRHGKKAISKYVTLDAESEDEPLEEDATAEVTVLTSKELKSLADFADLAYLSNVTHPWHDAALADALADAEDAPPLEEDMSSLAAAEELEVNAAPLPVTGTQLEFAAEAAPAAGMTLDAVAAAVVALEANATKQLKKEMINVAPEEAAGVFDGNMAMNLQEDSFREGATVNSSHSEAKVKVQNV